MLTYTRMAGDSLLVHFLCPYAQRALYALAYKGITSIRIEEVDLSNKSARLLEANPSGKIPTLRLESGGQKRFLYESLVVSEFFDSYPGPPLYPRAVDGQKDPFSKAALDILVKEIDSKLPPAFFAQYRRPSVDSLKELSSVITQVDKLVPKGCYFAYPVLGLDLVTIVDVITYSFVERLAVLRDDQGKEVFDRSRFGNLAEWFDRMSGHVWVQRFKAPPKRLEKLRSIILSGNYPGLQLPVTRYDS